MEKFDSPRNLQRTYKMLYHSFFSQHEIYQEYNPRLIIENTDELIQSYLTEIERVSGEFRNIPRISYGSSAD